MSEFLIFVAVGIVLGFLAGLGTGGGSLLILWLTAILGEEPQVARGINLLFFLPCAMISSFLRKKQGNLPFRKILPAIIAGGIGAAGASFFGRNLDVTVLQKLFGALLLVSGLRELFYKPQKNQRLRKAR